MPIKGLATVMRRNGARWPAQSGSATSVSLGPIARHAAPIIRGKRLGQGEGTGGGQPPLMGRLAPTRAQ